MIKLNIFISVVRIVQIVSHKLSNQPLQLPLVTLMSTLRGHVWPQGSVILEAHVWPQGSVKKRPVLAKPVLNEEKWVILQLFLIQKLQLGMYFARPYLPVYVYNFHLAKIKRLTSHFLHIARFLFIYLFTFCHLSTYFD